MSQSTDPLATCPSCKRCREWCGCEEEEEYPVETFLEPMEWNWTEEGFIAREAIRKITMEMDEQLGRAVDE